MGLNDDLLVGGIPTLPLWQMMEFVSWDYVLFPIDWKNMFQTTNQIRLGFSNKNHEIHEIVSIQLLGIHLWKNSAVRCPEGPPRIPHAVPQGARFEVPHTLAVNPAVDGQIEAIPLEKNATPIVVFPRNSTGGLEYCGGASFVTCGFIPLLCQKNDGWKHGFYPQNMGASCDFSLQPF